MEHLGKLGFQAAGKAVNKMSNSKSAYNKLISDQECIIADIKRKPGDLETRAYVRAGPREHLHFDPKTTVAAIVTCGGLCPGLNNVIRELTNTLHHLYGVKKVIGVRGGYAGFYTEKWSPITLTPELVANIHHKGGTMLASSRGGKLGWRAVIARFSASLVQLLWHFNFFFFQSTVVVARRT